RRPDHRCQGRHAGPCGGAAAGWPCGARLRDGDLISLDAEQGSLDVAVSPSAWMAREPEVHEQPIRRGWGRELFGFMRAAVSPAEEGGSSFTAGLKAADGGSGK
ncbi:MAG: dihydroxy-acid dehydratase, partial [Pseudomonas sp.]